MPVARAVRAEADAEVPPCGWDDNSQALVDPSQEKIIHREGRFHFLGTLGSCGALPVDHGGRAKDAASGGAARKDLASFRDRSRACKHDRVDRVFELATL